MTISGIVKQVGKTEKVNDKFTKRELILKTEHETKYPQYLVIQFTQGNVAKLDSISPGELVTVSINLKGREWNGPDGVKYFNTIEGWNIRKDENSLSPEQKIEQRATTGFAVDPSEDNSLPF